MSLRVTLAAQNAGNNPEPKELTMNSTVQETLTKYQALLDLEKKTGTRTTRARNELIRALNEADLTEFAVAFKQLEAR